MYKKSSFITASSLVIMAVIIAVRSYITLLMWVMFVVMKDIMFRFAYPQEILNHFFSRSYALFLLRNLAKMKDTTETVFQYNSSEAPQQNYMKLCSYAGHNV